MKTSSVLIVLSALCSSVAALGQNFTTTTVSSPGALLLADTQQNGQILLSANDWFGVIRVAEDLAGDFGKITGKNLTLGNWAASNATKRSLENRDVPAPSAPQGSNSSAIKAGNPPKSNDHNMTKSTGSGTTVYYTYQPITSFVNVSSQPLIPS